jgi:branched-chain amino acid transport system ATP-binding protein
MLSVRNLRVTVGDQLILADLSLDVPVGKVVTVIGRNGCGKSTALKAIMGLLPSSGSIRLFGEEISALTTTERSRRGLAYVPQSGAVFPNVTVHENLLLGGRLLSERRQLPGHLQAMYRLFPALGERRSALARYLSGGQLRMLAVAMALVRDARILLLDEPSAGVAPSVSDRLLEQLITAAGHARGILLVEQNLKSALERSDEVRVIRDKSASPPMNPADILARQSILDVL